MAKDPSTAPARRKSAKSSSEVGYPRINLGHLELIVCELKQSPAGSVKTEKQTRFSYSALPRDVGHYDKDDLPKSSRGATVGWCDFTATKQVDGETEAEVTATYLFAFGHPDDPPNGRWSREQLTEFVVSVCVWPRFRDLVANMMSQGSTTFPPLPLTPDRIAVAKGSDRTPEE